MAAVNKSSILGFALKKATTTLPPSVVLDVASYLHRTQLAPYVRRTLIDSRDLVDRFDAVAGPLTIASWCATQARRDQLATALVAPLSYYAYLLGQGVEVVIALEGRGRLETVGGKPPLANHFVQLNLVVAMVLRDLGIPCVLTDQTGEASAMAASRNGAILSIDRVDVAAAGYRALVIDAEPRNGPLQQFILGRVPSKIKVELTTAARSTSMLLALAVALGGEATSVEGAEASSPSLLAPPVCSSSDAEARTAAAKRLEGALALSTDPAAFLHKLLASTAAPTAVAPTRPDLAAGAYAWREFLVDVVAHKTLSAREMALAYFHELTRSVDRASAALELSPRSPTRVPVERSRKLLVECCWPEDAARRGAHILDTAHEKSKAVGSKLFGGGGSPRARSSSATGERPPTPEQREPPSKKRPVEVKDWVVRKQRPQPAPRRPRAPVEPTPAEPWTCTKCTYHHTDAEAEFLQCAMCGEKSA